MLDDHDDTRIPSGWSRRAVVSTLALGAAGLTPALASARTRDARGTVAVDAGGGGDTTDLEAAVAQAPPDTLITVAPGLYTVRSGQMHPREGVTIRGSGRMSVVRARAGLNTNLFQIHSDGVTIERLFVDGNGTAQKPSSSNGIYFDSAGGGRVLDCLVRDCAGYNIVGFPGARRWLVQGNLVESTGSGSGRWPTEGIELQGASQCRVIANHVVNARINGILLWNSTGDCSGNVIAANTIERSGRCGIWLEDGAHDNTVVGNAVADCTFGVRISDEGAIAQPSAGNVVSANICRGGAGAGLQLLSVGSQIVTANVCTNFTTNGFQVVGGSGSVLSDNRAATNGFSGFLLDKTAGVRLAGNLAEDNGGGNGAPDPWRSGFEVRAGSGPPIVLSLVGNHARNRSGAKQLRGLTISGDVSGRLADNELSAPEAMVIDGSRAALVAAPLLQIPVTVGTRPVALEHRLPYSPLSVSISMRSRGAVWLVEAPGESTVLLQADGVSRHATLFVG